MSPFATNTTALMATDNTSVDLDTLLSSLSHPSTQNTPNGSKSLSDYELIPTGLISLSNVSADSTKTKDSPIQAALRDYGNSAGNAIMSFENLHLNQASILKDHAEAPYDTGKVQLLARLGTDYIELGDTISKIDPIPLPLAALHKRLVADYRDLGKKLVAVSKSPGSLYDAIVEYDASADQFAKDFISLALTFPTSVAVPRSLEMEPGGYINAGCSLGAHSHFGYFVFINRGASIGHHARFGKFVSIGPGAVVAGEVTVGMGAMIGAGAVVLPEVTIAENSVVGAGAVVTRDVPAHCMVLGNPARIVKENIAGYKGITVSMSEY